MHKICINLAQTNVCLSNWNLEIKVLRNPSIKISQKPWVSCPPPSKDFYFLEAQYGVS
jgi:hypothetical protein